MGVFWLLYPCWLFFLRSWYGLSRTDNQSTEASGKPTSFSFLGTPSNVVKTLFLLCRNFVLAPQRLCFSSQKFRLPPRRNCAFLYCCLHCLQVIVVCQEILGGHACCESIAYLLRFCYGQMVDRTVGNGRFLRAFDSFYSDYWGVKSAWRHPAVLWRLGFDWLLRKQKLS